MTTENIVALLGAMTILALIPSPSVGAIIARAIASGFVQGMYMVIGILMGDFIFILFAIYGLSAIAEQIDVVFLLLKYLGSAYLIWLGIQLSLAQTHSVEITPAADSSIWSSFLSGLLITLGDYKAIFFYLSFFPAFLDLTQVSIIDMITVMAIATVAVGGIKLGYVYLADKARLLLKSAKAKKTINLMAATVTIGTGVYLLLAT